MKDEDIIIYVYDQIDMLIEKGYLDPSQREVAIQRLYEQKKGQLALPLKMTS